MNRYAIATALASVAAAGLVTLAVAGPVGAVSAAPGRPTVQSLSSHSGAYWGGGRITIHGQNFVNVRGVSFGSSAGGGVQVSSPTTLSVVVPWYDYATVDVHVVTASGTSAVSAADRYTFTAPTMATPIQGPGGLTGYQEQAISAAIRARHVTPGTAAGAAAWTPAMGATAANRALSWLGLPYSWAGGNGSGPTAGVCAHNGGDLDCHIDGFDCSGLALYSWAPYRAMDHFAATQYTQAGRFHPTIGELMPGDLLFFSAYPGGQIDHVVIYIGNGQIVEAPESGEQVHVAPLANLLAWSVFSGATRPTSVGPQGPAPTIASYTSPIPTKGGQVTVTGSNLASVTSVTIGGTRIYSFAQRTASRLVFTAPAHAGGAVSLEVDNSWGSATRTLSYLGAPGFSGISAHGGSTAGGNVITLSGVNLGPVKTVVVGSSNAAFTVLGNTKLTVRMPAHAAGNVVIVATSPYGSSGKVPYVYLAPPKPPAPPTAPPTSSAPPTTPPTTPPTVSASPSPSPTVTPSPSSR